MPTEQEEIAELKRRLDNLVKIVRGMDDQLVAMFDILKGHRKDINHLFRSDKFLFDKLFPVFHKVFPNDIKFQAEFERILGRDVGPEEPKKGPNPSTDD